jgi:putative ABC transport system permease protein
MIPLKYNLRNLRVRWTTTALTVLATGLVVGSSCILFGMVEGLRESLKVSGDPLDLLVIRRGSSSETNGYFAREAADTIGTLTGIARDPSGMPLIANEVLSIPVVERTNGSRTNLMIRGVEPASRALRKDFKILEGRDLVSGRNEAVVSRSVSRRFKGAQLGGILRISDKEAYRVIGIFSAGGTAAESEAWVDRKDLERNTSNLGIVSSVQLRAASPGSLAELQRTINNDQRFKLLAHREADYYAEQDRTALVLTVIGTLIAVLLSIGAMFAAANTMFAAVRSRTREIGTMRALGFSRFDVLVSFLGESLILCTMGGLLGWLATWPLAAFLTFNTTDFNSFAERSIQFRFGPLVFAVAFGMTAVMGLFGGLFPAIRAIRLNVIDALREL